VVARSLAWTISTEVATKGSVLALSVVAARALDPESFAQFLAFVALAIMASGLWDVGVSSLLTREVASGRIGVRESLRQAARIRGRSLPLWIGAFVVGSVVAGALAPLEPASVALFAVASLAMGTRMVLAAALQGILAFRAVGLTLATGRIVTALAATPALGVDDEESTFIILAGAVTLGEVLAVVLAALSLTRLSGRTGGRDAPSTCARLSLRASAPFAANAFMATVYNRLDILLVAALTTSVQTAAYAPASRVQDALLIVPGSIGVVAFPMVARRWTSTPEAVGRLVVRLATVGLAIALPLAICVFMFAPSLLRVVLGEDYVAAAEPVRILVWSLPLTALAAPLLAGLAGVGRAADTTKVFGVALATALVMHLSLDWWWGATGAAVATLSRDPAALVLAVYLAWRAGLLGQRQGVGAVSATSARPPASREGVL